MSDMKLIMERFEKAMSEQMPAIGMGAKFGKDTALYAKKAAEQKRRGDISRRLYAVAEQVPGYAGGLKPRAETECQDIEFVLEKDDIGALDEGEAMLIMRELMSDYKASKYSSMPLSLRVIKQTGGEPGPGGLKPPAGHFIVSADMGGSMVNTCALIEALSSVANKVYRGELRMPSGEEYQD